MLRQLSKISLYASLFAILVVMTSTLFPFIGGKDYFYRFTVELALVFFVLWWAFEDTEGEAVRRIKEMYKKPLFIAVTVFMVAMLLATFFAEDSHAAFWSNYERGEGTFQMLHYYISFLLMSVLFTTEEDWKRVFRVSLVSAAGLILYGALGVLGWADNFITPFQGGQMPVSVWERFVGPRFQGTLGNPAYVAPYLMFSMFYAVYLWVTSRNRRSMMTIVAWGLSLATIFFFFMVSQTRGAFIGLVLAVLAVLITMGFMNKKFRAPSLGIIVSLLLAGSILVHYRASGFVQGLPGGRMFDMPFSDSLLVAIDFTCLIIAWLVEFAREKKFLWWVLAGFMVLVVGCGIFVLSSGRASLSDQTTDTRFWTWGSAWKGFLDRPVFGWGQENFSAVFDKYFDPRHFSPLHNSETWFDRAHGIAFDYLAETGIIGFLSYLAIFAVIYFHLFKKKVEEGSHSGAIVKALVFALPLGYLAQGLAIFDVLPMYINLFLFFAFGYYYFYNSNSHESAA